MSLVEVNDLSVNFKVEGGTLEAVRAVSFQIEKGETVALVGESGSGKSVTALSILQLLPYPKAWHPSGSIRLDGRELIGADEPTLREVRGDQVGIIFQEPMTSLNPLHTIDRQIGETLMLHRGMSKSEARARALELLHLVRLQEAEERLGAYPHQLSGGQRQRVMIAMALANEPDLLIADEPTTALDVTIQAQILKLLKDLQQRLGMAMLLITHDLTIVRKIADRVCVMTDGRIVETGAVEDVFERPRHPYTQHLLAAEPKGRPLDRPDQAPVVIAARQVKVHFPIQRGLLRRTVGYVKAVDGVDVAIRRGQTVGVVGESGSGKTTLGLALLRLIRSEGGIRFGDQEIQGWASRRLRPLRRHMQIVFQDPFGSLSPRMSVGQIVEEGLKLHRHRRRPRRPAAPGRQGAPGGRPRSRQPGPLPPRVLRRPAATDQHRARDRARAELRGARRADLGARHVGAGADRRPAARSAGAARAGLHVHQSRPARGARAQRSGHRDARRPGGRARPRAGDLRAPAAFLYPGADGCGIRDRGGRDRVRGDLNPPLRRSQAGVAQRLQWGTAVGDGCCSVPGPFPPIARNPHGGAAPMDAHRLIRPQRRRSRADLPAVVGEKWFSPERGLWVIAMAANGSGEAGCAARGTAGRSWC